MKTYKVRIEAVTTRGNQVVHFTETVKSRAKRDRRSAIKEKAVKQVEAKYNKGRTIRGLRDIRAE